MDIICVLFFDPNGSLEKGYDFVKLRIENANGKNLFQDVGKLPAAPEIIKLRRKWSSHISQSTLSLATNFRASQIRAIQPGENSYTSSEYVKKVKESLKTLKTGINNWLSSTDFQTIRSSILSRCDSTKLSKLIIETENIELQRLPWHLWDCSEQYIKFTEVAISSTRYKKVDFQNSLPRKKVRILSILGNSSNINTTKDREILENNIDAEVKFLVEPSQEKLFQHINDPQGWDILFFAGHSKSQLDGKDGELLINKKDHLKVSELEGVLRDAITRGLTLAIFNSCDGIGIANNLVSWDIPNVIVMREPVPDLVAQEFFKALISEFSHNQQYLSLAIAKARQHLHWLEYKYPCASSLPLLFNNASEPTLSWQKLPAIKTRDRIVQIARPQLETPLLQDYINISLIGDRASGKTTYIASLLRNPNPPASSIINSISPVNENARKLEYLARKRIEQGELLRANDPANLSKIRDYSFKMMLQKYPSLWKQLFSSKPSLEEFKFNLIDYDGKLFNSLGQPDEDNTSLIQDYAQLLTRSTGIMLMIALTSDKKDITHEQNVKKLLAILDREQNNLKCQRIALVFTKCDRPELLPWLSTPQTLAEQHFPLVNQQLQAWQQRSHGELGYFSTSAFGFLSEFKPKANVKKNDLKQDVLDSKQCWRPVDLVDPIYWLATV